MMYRIGFYSSLSFLIACLAVPASGTVISDALGEVYDTGSPVQPASEENSMYLRVIPSRTGDRSTLIYRCRHVAVKSITDSVESATTTTGIVETSADQNMLTVNDENAQIEELRELILALDSRGPQVLVEAQIVEVQMGDSEEWDTGLNINYDGESSGGFMLGGSRGFPSPGEYPDTSGGWASIVGSPSDMLEINARLRWLQSTDKAEILSSPNLLVDLGATAAVSTGTDQPLLNVSINNGVSQESVYYKRTGVNLRVTPLLINDDTVTIEVRPEVTSVVGTAALSASTEAPLISVRNIDTKLNVKDGGVVMMGGLYSSKDIESEERVPFLSAIPLIGRLFKGQRMSQEQVQLIFLLKVTIVPDSLDSLLDNLDSTRRQMKAASGALADSLVDSVVEPDSGNGAE